MIVIKVSENNNGDKKRSREYTYKGTMMIIQYDDRNDDNGCDNGKEDDDDNTKYLPSVVWEKTDDS